MVDNPQEPPLSRSLAAEAFGAFALVFVDAGGAVVEAVSPGGGVTPLARSLATGLLITALIYSLGPVSGAHVNPAVTAAFAVRGVFPWRRVGLYMAAQLGGAIGAALLLRALFGTAGGLGATQPQHGALAAFVMEILLTLFLVTVILSTATRYRVIGANAALAVGAVIAACGLFSRPISGTSLNPARSIGPAVVSGNVADLWIYVIAPLAGAGLAVMLVDALYGRPKSGEEKAAGGEQAPPRGRARTGTGSSKGFRGRKPGH
jgi:MIP family channel proteins